MNDLQLFFESNSGRLIHKWIHYFEIYDRHFSKFRGQEIYFLEIGVFHGGSLQMWKHYFGDRAKIVGVDINPRCKELEEDGVEIIIGSQEDREFLASIKSKLPRIDILLDDGGHTMQQQITTFEELFPHISSNGVYLCEDLHTSYWDEYGGGLRKPSSFIEYSKHLIDSLNAWHVRESQNLAITGFTRTAHSISYYDSILVIEKKPIPRPQHRMTGHPSFDVEEITPIMARLEKETESLESELFSSSNSINNIFNPAYQAAISAENQLQSLKVELEKSLRERQQLQDELQRCELLQQNTLAETQNHQTQLIARIADLEESQNLLRVQIEQMRSKLHHKQEKVKELKAKLQFFREELARSKDEITAIKASRVWWLKTQWLKLKQLIRLT